MKLAGALLGCLFAAAAAGVAPSRPNIIVVLSDDVGLSRIGCYGGAPFQTPHLDRLAATGLRFERCYSMPLCGPSRAALLTGLYPFRTGAVDNNTAVLDPARHRTLPAVMRAAGYATCTLGKLGQIAGEGEAGAPARLAFDESMLWMGRGTPDRYWHPRYIRNGAVAQGRPDQYGPDLTHDFLVDFLQRHRDRPCFVYYSAVLTHFPFTRTPDSRDDKHPVEDMVAYLDKQMGRLVADLERLGLRENTLLLFTSDNGPQGNPLGTIRGAPLVGGKGEVTEGGVREPLIINCPARVPGGRVCRDLTDFTDIFPTVLELAGITPPPDLRLDGRSIAPQILGRPGQPREWVYAQVGKKYFIADQRYKLYGDGRFVDIGDSPVAEKPVATDDAAGAAAQQRLRTALTQLRGQAVADSPAPAQAGHTPLRADAAPDLAADVQVLVEHKLIVEAAAGYWRTNAVASAQLEGARVAELMLAIARHFKPAATGSEALAVLQQEGILNSQSYWKQHAREGEQCGGANVARLLNKTAQRIKTP